MKNKAEELKRKINVPDEDGWITVTKRRFNLKIELALK